MRKFLLSLAFVAITICGHSQLYNMGFGLKGGVTNFLGDIGGGDEARGFLFNMEMKDTRWSTGVFWRYRFHPLFATQVNFGYNRLNGRDSESENYARNARNLNFRNDIFDFSGRIEYYPQVLRVRDVGYRGIYKLEYETYFTVGLGGVVNNPKADYLGDGDYVKLRPLMTEGEKYKPVALILPMGGGFYFTYKFRHRIGMEFLWNWTFTDYLDDISDQYVSHSDPTAAKYANQYVGGPGTPAAGNFEAGSPRGDPTDRDNYMVISVSYSLLFRTGNSIWRPKFGGRFWKIGKGDKAMF